MELKLTMFVLFLCLALMIKDTYSAILIVWLIFRREKLIKLDKVDGINEIIRINEINRFSKINSINKFKSSHQKIWYMSTLLGIISAVNTYWGSENNIIYLFWLCIKKSKRKKNCFNSLSRHDNFSNLKDTKMPRLKLPL